MKKQRFNNIVTVVLFIAFLFSLTVVFAVSPSEDFSPEEKRELQQFPELSFESFRNGDFTSRMNTYLNDQFPFRNEFRHIKYLSEAFLGKNDNNGVLFGENGQLAVRLFSVVDGNVHGKDYSYPETDSFYPQNIEKCFEALKKAADFLYEKNISLKVILPPRTVDVAVSAFSYPSDSSYKLIAFVRSEAKKVSHAEFIDMYDTYRDLYDKGEYVYFKTDHHWTSLGAYYAYDSIIKSLGGTPYGKNDFTFKTVSTDFYGTTYSKCGSLNVSLDTIDAWDCKYLPSSSFKMTILGKNERTFEGFYDESYLSSYDKYSYFLSGTNTHTEIRLKNGTDRPRMLVLKDSFGHSLSPFLALNYDLTVVNLTDLYSVIDRIDIDSYDTVLVCFNLENIITTSNLSKITSLLD